MYQELIDNLPAPETKEEQYIYALVCAVAEVENKKKFSNSPFYRTEQYWKAFYMVMAGRLKDFLSTKPKAGEVGSESLQDQCIDESKLANDISNRLLGDNRVTEPMMVADVKNKLLGDGRVVENMLEADIKSKLLKDNSVATDMLQDSSVTESKLSADVQTKLNTTVTDEHINQLIDAKLGVIENGTY